MHDRPREGCQLARLSLRSVAANDIGEALRIVDLRTGAERFCIIQAEYRLDDGNLIIEDVELTD